MRPRISQRPYRQHCYAALLALALTGTGLPAMAAPRGDDVELLINEIDYDQPGTDIAEFIELKNVGCAPVNLDPYELRLINGSGGGATLYRTINLPAVILAAGDYFVVCGNAGMTVNCDLDVTPNTDLIQNGNPDAVALFNTARVPAMLIDTVSYGGNTAAPYTETAGMLFGDSGTTGGSIGRDPDGVDTNNNMADFEFHTTISPGAPNVTARNFGGPCTGDVDESGTVNVSDLLAVINAWGPCVVPTNCPADVAPPACGDDVVNVSDLLTVINNWGPCL